MTESELLRRFDLHLERSDQHMEKVDQHMARVDQHMARGNEIMAEANQIHREHREFIREMTVRQERVTEQLVRRIDANTEVLIAGRHVLEDVALATRQHTQALAKVLDRLP